MDEIDNMDLPVMAFMIDWKDGLVERLEYKTDVLPDIAGNEQTRALRLTPRREFDATLTLWGQERQYWDLWLHRMVDKEFMFPLWHDSFRMRSFGTFLNLLRFDPAAEGVEVGDMLMFRGQSSLDFQIVRVAQTIQGQDPHVLLENIDGQPWPVTAGNQVWPHNSRLWRLQRGRLVQSSTVEPVTDRSSRTKITVECTREQPFAASVDGMDTYLDRPVFTVEPNRSASLDQEYEWAFGESDNSTGRRYRKSDSGRPTVRQKQTWWLKGRQSKQTFRAFLERQRGSARTLWLPTFNDDITLSRDAAIAAQSIYCKRFGFAYTGGVSSGREHIAIKTRGGYLYRKVTGTAAAGPGEERLTISPPLPTGLRMADVKRISWMDVARLENDRFEIEHVTDTHGIATCAAVMKTVRDERVPPAILSLPIPLAQMNSARCGEEDDDACAPLPVDWVHRFTLSAPVYQCNPNWDGNVAFEWPDIRPNGPGGKPMNSYGGYWNAARPDETIYDNFVANSPILQGQKLLTFTMEDFNNWTVTLYFDPPSLAAQDRYINIFPSARFCGSWNGPKDPDGYGRFEMTHSVRGSPPVSLGLRGAGGNSDARWYW